MTAPLVGPYATPRRAQRTARRRDRRVYLRSHPVLFALLAATRRRPVVRIGRTVLVHGTEAYREVLTRVPLDRTAAGTTGGAAARLTDGGLLFDQDGAGHRAARRALSADLGSGAVARLRPLWQGVLDERLAVLDQAGPTRDGHARGGRAAVGLPTVDLVELARELAGVTTAALTACAADPLVLARAAADAAAATARDHLPGPRRPGGAGAAARAAAGRRAQRPHSQGALRAGAAVNTTG
ncbi:cytochrome P450, partial [Kitasatospora indigofera]